MTDWSNSRVRFWRRRRFVVLPRLQGRLVGSAVLSVFLCWLVVGIALFVPIAEQIENPADPRQARRAAEVLLYLHDRLASLGVVLFVLVVLLAVRASHRVAGPLYRVRRYLDAAAAGDPPQEVRFRHGDWIDELVPSLRKLFARMRALPLAPIEESGERQVPADPRLPAFRKLAHGPRSGFTLIEIMIVCLVISILGSIALPRYLDVVSKAEEEVVLAELREIADELEAHWRMHGEYPLELTPPRLDPWGHPYVYLRIEEPREGMTAVEYEKKQKEKAEKISPLVRKDKNLHPLNTDFDLYSMGPDGKSNVPLTAEASRDDVIRANNGQFFGRAEDF